MARLPFLMLGALALLAGAAAGLARLGWPMPAPVLDWAALHGPLMVSAFFGTVIGLERAVALNRPWGFAAPAATALGGIALLAAASGGFWLLVLGALLFLALALVALRRQWAAYTAVMALGALAWVAGALGLALGGDVAASVPAWIAFLVLTITGERLELSRFLAPSRWRLPALWPGLALTLLAAVLAPWSLPTAWIALGLGCLGLALWMGWHDVARRTVKMAGLPRFVALCLISGQAWLAVAGVLMVGMGDAVAGPHYDAALHALFVGFVFAMVFGHAPVILPALLGLRLPFTIVFYLPLAGLHLSLLLRLGGDLFNLPTSRQWGGLGNAGAILLFIVVTAGIAIAARRSQSGAQRLAQEAEFRLARAGRAPRQTDPA